MMNEDQVIARLYHVNTYKNTEVLVVLINIKLSRVKRQVKLYRSMYPGKSRVHVCTHADGGKGIRLSTSTLVGDMFLFCINFQTS
jgi:hypothetical protein